MGHNLGYRLFELTGNPHPAGSGNFLMRFSVKLKSLDFQGTIAPGNRTVGMTYFGIGNLFLLQLHEGLMEGTRTAESSLDQLTLLISNHQPPVVGHRMQTTDQVGQGIMLAGHGNEKIGIQIFLEPIEIFFTLETALVKNLFNFPRHFIFQFFQQNIHLNTSKIHRLDFYFLGYIMLSLVPYS